MIRQGALLLCWLLLRSCALAAPVPSFINTIPAATPSATFLTTLNTFLGNELAQELTERGVLPGVTAGCLGLTGAGLSMTPVGTCVGYPGNYRVTETGAILFADASTTWVILHTDTTGNVVSNQTFTRVTGTHYAIYAGASQPQLPSNSLWLMKVTTAGGAVTAVTDLRYLLPDARVVRPVPVARTLSVSTTSPTDMMTGTDNNPSVARTYRFEVGGSWSGYNTTTNTFTYAISVGGTSVCPISGIKPSTATGVWSAVGIVQDLTLGAPGGSVNATVLVTLVPSSGTTALSYACTATVVTTTTSGLVALKDTITQSAATTLTEDVGTVISIN